MLEALPPTPTAERRYTSRSDEPPGAYDALADSQARRRELGRGHALDRLLAVSDASDVDLVSHILGATRTGPPPRELASELLEECAGLPGVRRLGAPALVEFGLLDLQAARLLAALELGTRALVAELSEQRPVLSCFEEVVDWARPRLGALEHEEVWLLSLDGANGLIRGRRVAQGGLHGCALLPRDVLRPALRDAASAFILVHNHPSGDPTPSPDDVDMTRQLAQAARLVGTPLLDHIVVARAGASSLLDLGAF